MNRFLQHSIFVLRFRYLTKPIKYFRTFWFRLCGMCVGKNTLLPAIYVTWPHQVSIGESCNLEKNLYFKFDGIWKPGASIMIGKKVFIGFGCEFNIRKSITVGDYCLIASGCRFIDHDHGITLGQLIGPHPGPEEPIKIGNNVWLGCNVVVLKGVIIGDGAVIAAGAVVTKSILSNEIWGGIPAKKIGDRKE